MGFKDGERRGDNDGDREEAADSDDEDSECLRRSLAVEKLRSILYVYSSENYKLKNKHFQF